MRQVELRQYPNMYQIWRRAETIPICTRYGVGVEFSHIHSIPHNFIKKFSYFIIKGKGGEFNSPLRHAGKKLSFKNAKHPAKWRQITVANYSSKIASIPQKKKRKNYSFVLRLLQLNFMRLMRMGKIRYFYANWGAKILKNFQLEAPISTADDTAAVYVFIDIRQ